MTAIDAIEGVLHVGPYVVVDLETTGLDPYRDAIIQVALRRSDGSVWSSWVNPGRRVPDAILRLTGIRPEDLATAPDFREILPTVREWLQSGRVVGHNIAFDLAFLARHGLFAAESLDTLEWSRLAFPLRAHHGLPDWFPEEGDRLHDARVDTEMTERLMRAIRDKMSHFSRELKRDMAYFLGNEWQWWDIPFDDQGHTQKSALYRPEPDLFQAESLAPVEITADPVEWLSPHGALADAVDGFQARPGQQRMARAVDDALSQGDILMVEAGTGTGKSLAYLSPAILTALRQGERVVVATHTVALQDQLWGKDLPQASRDLPIRTALVKGRGRYLCLFKAAEVVQDTPALGESRERRWALATLLSYIEATEIGDAEEFPLKNEAGRAIWTEVVADSQACAGPRCPFAGPCFMRRARHQAESSHLVVVNHALLAAHAANGNVLPPFSHLIVDEAHHLGEVLERSLGFELDAEAFRRRYRDVMHTRTGIWARLALPPEFLGVRHSIQERYQQLLDGLETLGRALAEATPPGEYDRRAVRVTPARWELLQEQGVESLWQAVNDRFRELVDETELLWQEVQSRQNVTENASWLRYRQWQQDMVELAVGMAAWGQVVDERVSWWEMRTGRDGETIATWRWAPVDIAPILRENLWDGLDSAVLTSATLTVHGRFDYLQTTLGIPAERLKTLNVGSPFDWERQARLLIPTDSPDPADNSYWERLADLVVEAARRREGRTLVLLTSYRAVEAVAWRIRERLEAYHIRTLAQGVDGPARRLVGDFRHDPRAVLLGTMTYWEGVDIPGSDLEVVIMGRLPFRAPGDPLEEAKQERIAQRGQSPFYRRSLPEAVLRFQQGFGRLIRTTQDHGVVVVFDPRIQPGRTRYANVFLASLKQVPRVAGSQADLLKTIEAFWEEHHAHSHK
ncbi:helicase C-terminal domain-containing protein [Sulfobacillus harzensis]|uniref:DNA 5'-3' helicase n=1 Tax=Sulfobacillus harzensis TaxID=2729629 RepID=A0A7Y0Q2B0_9FIRM|nr:helicase C-terminal domain-containing protein [Sulfobacillus harzensis]NMP22277.1 DNA polymerase III [Sulfobacillus harzensis]